jgi:hypothetical protein
MLQSDFSAGEDEYRVRCIAVLHGGGDALQAEEVLDMALLRGLLVRTILVSRSLHSNARHPVHVDVSDERPDEVVPEVVAGSGRSGDRGGLFVKPLRVSAG